MEVSKEPDFPEGWWTDEKLFMLERRAIFSKVMLSKLSFVTKLTL